MLKEMTYNDCKEAALAAGLEIKTYQTGVRELDRVLDGGFYAGVTVLGGLPGYGKSTLAAQIAYKQYCEGRTVYIYSNELFGRDYGIMFSKLERVMGVTKNENDNLKVVELGINYTADEVLQHIEKKRKECGELVVVIDFLQRFLTYACESEPRNYIDAFVNKLQELAYRLQIPIILLSSLNNACQRSTKMDMTAFKESSGIAYGADILMVFENESKDINDKQVEYRLSILKNRKKRLIRETIKLIFNSCEGYFSSDSKKFSMEKGNEQLDFFGTEWKRVNDEQTPFGKED